MASPVDDRGVDAFLSLLQDGSSGPRPKVEALEALSLRPVWLATWEPRAEGFRTLINANGEEALAVFSSEKELKAAATQFGWLENDGSVATHRAIGGDILRHAWTREYAFVVIDVGADHSLEYPRAELKSILRELDTTGPFRTSRPPAPEEANKKPAASSFPPPIEKPPERISTLYSMSPSQSEKIDRLSDLPTKPHDVPYDSEPPTQPRAAPPEREPERPHDSEPPTQPRAARPEPEPERARKSSRPKHKAKSEPPGVKIEEVGAGEAALGDGGTYGAASIIPPTDAKHASGPPPPPKDPPPPPPPVPEARRASSAAPRPKRLKSDAPTAPAAQPLPTLEPGKLKLPAVGPVTAGGVEPLPPQEATAETEEQVEERPKTQAPARVIAPSIGDGIKLVELYDPPNDELLDTLGRVLRGYFEVEWASYCQVARPAGGPSPAVGLRVADNYRDNVTAIIKELCEAARKHEIEIDVLLIDGHDLLRKAREKAVVFYPWKRKA